MKVGEYHIGFVGFGHMAQTICRAIERAKLIPPSQISFIRRDPHKSRENEQEFGITSTSLENLVDQSHLILLCVRPNQADFVLKDLARLKAGTKMIVSIMAGIKLSSFQKYLGSQIQVLRMMPNSASAIGEGLSVFAYGHQPSIEFRSLTNLLFSCLGETVEVTENLMDIASAIAGSGPGFAFRLIEAMARAGEKQGLSYAKALKMASHAFLGGGRLIAKGVSPETLIQQIATPNGMTEAGFKMMNQTQIDTHLQAVVEAAAKRSKEISEEFY